MVQRTGAWVVSISGEPGAPTLHEQRQLHSAAIRESVADHPLVAATLATFPDAEIRDVRKVGIGQVEYDIELDENANDADAEPANGDDT